MAAYKHKNNISGLFTEEGGCKESLDLSLSIFLCNYYINKVFEEKGHSEVHQSVM